MLGHFLDAENPPNHRSRPNPKREAERERQAKISNTKQITTTTRRSMQDKGFIPRFGNPQRSSYILVVEVTTKVGVSFTSLPLSKQPQRSLEFSTKKTRVIQTFQGSSTRWKLLGDA
jgi:hypothetical protein